MVHMIHHVCIYEYIHIYLHVHIYIYIYTQIFEFNPICKCQGAMTAPSDVHPNTEWVYILLPWINHRYKYGHIATGPWHIWALGGSTGASVQVTVRDCSTVLQPLWSPRVPHEARIHQCQEIYGNLRSEVNLQNLTSFTTRQVNLI